MGADSLSANFRSFCCVPWPLRACCFHFSAVHVCEWGGYRWTSELEALEEAADGLEAPLEPSTGFLNPGFTEHLDPVVFVCFCECSF